MGVDTGVTGEQRELLDVSKRFMETACPLTTVRDGSWRDAAFAASYRRQAAELGWYSMLVPEALGGGSISGNGVLDAALIAYERGGLLQPGPFVGTNVVTYTIGAAGSDELREKALPSLISGEVSASWAAHATGEGARADAGVQGSSSSGGGLELNGAKNVVADAMGSAWLLVPAAGPDGAVQALVPADAPGVTATELESLDLSRRFADVRFEGVQVPAANVIAADADLATTQLAIACALLVAETVGAMDHDFAMTVQYAKDRIAFGRPIGSFQGVKHQLADTSMALEMSKAVALAAARSLGAHDGYGPESASMAKAFVGEAGIDLAQTCFQVFAGIGYTWEHDQHLYLRRITTDAGLFGDPAWHREHLCQLAGL